MSHVGSRLWSVSRDRSHSFVKNTESHIDLPQNETPRRTRPLRMLFIGTHSRCGILTTIQCRLIHPLFVSYLLPSNTATATNRNCKLSIVGGHVKEKPTRCYFVRLGCYSGGSRLPVSFAHEERRGQWQHLRSSCTEELQIRRWGICDSENEESACPS